MATDYVVLAKDFARVEYETHEGPWEPEPSVSEVLEAIWQKKKAEDDAKGVICENYSMARVKSYHETNRTLFLNLQYTDWKHFVVTRDIQDAASYANPLSVGGLTITSDGHVVAGRKSPMVEVGVGQFQLTPCGYVSWEDVKGRGNGIASAMFRHMDTELSLTPFRPMALVERPKVRQPMLIAELRVPFDREEIIETHGKIEKKQSDELVFVEADPEAIADFLEKRSKELRPHLRCGLELYRERLIGRKV